MNSSDKDEKIPDLTSVEVPKASGEKNLDEALAEEALFRTAQIAFGQTGLSVRLAALNTILSYTKAKPVTKLDVKSDSHDEWLRNAVAANEALVKKQ